MKTVQQTLTGEVVIHQTREPAASITDIIWLLIKYFISTASIQRTLFLLSFLTYGIGDGISAVYMMERTGVMREINPIVRFLYVSYGEQGLIIIKIWFTLLILFFVWIVSRRTNTYWTINGFLSALFVGGIMAMYANLTAANNMVSLSSSSVITTYLALTVLLVLIGDLIDNTLDKHSSTRG